MPTDPVQVVAEAPCIIGGLHAERDESHRGAVHPECAVAALKAAGALMPDEAEELRRSGAP